ncbi:MAG: peptidase M61 [Granulosicoccaceae bacterium]
MSSHYIIQAVSPQAHLYEVTLKLDDLDVGHAPVRLRLPDWIPGSYMIRDFSQHIVALQALSDGYEIAVTRVDKSCWECPAGLSSLEVTYRVYAWDLSVRAAHLDLNHGFFNGTSVFLYAEGLEQNPVTVDIQLPSSPECKSWQVATSLSAADIQANGFGLYKAANYDELIDHPVEMGTFTRCEFEACGVPHEIIFTGPIHTDLDRVANDLKRICEYQINFFGKPAPMDHYVFLVMVVGSGYGGLEHRASTALMITRENLPIPGDDSTHDGYLSFLGLCSHEYFHTWNVKRIKPAAFTPFDLQAENYTRLLWFFEGMTSYYDDLFLRRCGLIDDETYFKLVAKNITRIQRTGGRLVQTVTDSSFDAWHKFYKQNENSPNAIVSYYGKGALVAMCLDAILRKRSSNKVTLDHLMRALWQRWLNTGEGLQEQEPESVATELLGQSLDDFFQPALYGTSELDLEKALTSLGVQLNWRQRQSAADTGGKIDKSGSFYWIGANVHAGEGDATLSHVFTDGAAERAGLAAGDKLVAIEELAVDSSNLVDILKRYASQGKVRVHYFRLGVLSTTTMPIVIANNDTAYLTLQDKEKAMLWLMDPANHPA